MQSRAQNDINKFCSCTSCIWNLQSSSIKVLKMNKTLDNSAPQRTTPTLPNSEHDENPMKFKSNVYTIASLSYISPSIKPLHEEVSCNHLCVIFVHVCVAGQWAAVHGVARSRTQLSDFTFPFHFHALEKEMATHSSVLAWRIPGTGEPGGLPSMGSHRVGHD